MSYIFISYSKYDRLYAYNLAEVIRSSGFDIWIDDHIDYGNRWWQSVMQGIHDCAVFVVVMSPHSERSEWIEREILVAQRESKPIFPLLLSGVPLPLLITRQYFDVRENPFPNEEFYERLRQIVSPTKPEGNYIIPEPRLLPSHSQKHDSPFLNRGIILIFLAIIAITLFIYFRRDIEIGIQRTMPNMIVRSYPDWQPQEHSFLDVEMVLVPAGCFIDKMLHSQCFQSTFWIDKYEVTQATFERLGGIKDQEDVWKGDNLPITHITAEEALLFCQIRGGRLPTATEWEYASLSRAGRIHSLAIQIDTSKIVAAHTSNNQPAEVGTYPDGASWVGALDLLGNVWEWTMSDGRHYTLHGGSWRSLPGSLSIALMMLVIPDFRSDDAGFRCVIEG